MPFIRPTIIENVTKASRPFFENIYNGIEEAKVSAAPGTENVGVGTGVLGGGKVSGEGKNVGVGYEALASAETARNCVAIGHKASHLNKTGQLQIAIGDGALEESLVAYNIAIGRFALKTATGMSNIALGHENMRGFLAGEYNMALGQNTLLEYKEGHGICAVGTAAMEKLVEGEQSTAVGTNSQTQTLKTPNVSVGFNTLTSNTTGVGNTVVGTFAMEKGTAPAECVAIGHEALLNFSGSKSVGVGYAALEHSESGNENTSIGNSSLVALKTGKENTAGGFFALGKVVSGNTNTAMGTEAGLNLTAASSGNVCVGYQAGPTAEGEHSELLYIHNKASNEPLIQGSFSAKELKFNTTKLGFFGVTPVTKPAKATTVAEVVTALESLGLMA
jgi:trimeric autotransporter adhesin